MEYPSIISSLLIAIISLIRGLPLFFSARPKTPLRVLCIIAVDAISMLRRSQRLTSSEIRMLAVLLDFGACANAVIDNKEFCRHEFESTLRQLMHAGVGTTIAEFLGRLRELERKRPSPGGDRWQFQRVRLYREAVVRLWLGIVVGTALGNRSVDEGMRATYSDQGLEALFRIVMQCQIMDDVLDFSQDSRAGLPSFLTGVGSLSQAFELTRSATLEYAFHRGLRSADILPFRLALSVVSNCAVLVLLLGRFWQGVPLSANRAFVYGR